MVPTLAELAWLPAVRKAVAVVAHPDDESFGLGAVLHALAAAGTTVDVLCLTHGEASTLGASDDLGDLRSGELESAARQLGLARVTLLDHPDGALAATAAGVLEEEIAHAIDGASLVVVFEPNGVTGHPDHRAASAAGLRVARRHGIPTLEWGVHPHVAASLRAEFGAPFVALDGSDTFDVTVDRRAQLAAIACHRSQADDNAVLRRRLALQGDRERLRYRSPG